MITASKENVSIFGTLDKIEDYQCFKNQIGSCAISNDKLYSVIINPAYPELLLAIHKELCSISKSVLDTRRELVYVIATDDKHVDKLLLGQCMEDMTDKYNQIRLLVYHSNIKNNDLYYQGVIYLYFVENARARFLRKLL